MARYARPAEVGRNRLRRAVDALSEGRTVALIHDLGDAPQSSLVVAGQTVETRDLAFVVRYSSGFVAAALLPELAERLGITRMYTRGDTQDVYRVTVDAAEGTTTGISAADRARTLQVLASPDSVPDDLIRPGHVATIVVDGERPNWGDTAAEASIALLQRAGLTPVAGIASLVDEVAGHVMSPAETAAFCLQHQVPFLYSTDVVRAEGPDQRSADAARSPEPATVAGN